jgi:hypothetical protein
MSYESAIDDGNKVTTADGSFLRPTKSFWQRPQILTQPVLPKQKMTSHQVTNIYFETNEAPTKKRWFY